MCKINTSDKQLWVRKTVTPCWWNKATVNKPDTLETFRKMSCYSSPYIICHMTPQLNLLLQKKKKSTSSCWFPWDLDRGKTTQQKGVWEGIAFASFLLRRKWLADQELVLTLPGARTWNKDLEHTQMRMKMQLQVIINGNRQLEKTVTSYANTTSHAFCISLPCGALYSSFR